jgi:hypothetical protein
VFESELGEYNPVISDGHRMYLTGTSGVRAFVHETKAERKRVAARKKAKEQRQKAAHRAKKQRQQEAHRAARKDEKGTKGKGNGRG